MIKKIATENLKVGMYIHDLDAGWMEHPFFSSHFTLNKESQIESILAAGIHHVYIDTAKGLDDDQEPLRLDEDELLIEPELEEQSDVSQGSQVRQVPLTAELVRARAVLHEAHEAIRDLMQRVHNGDSQLDQGIVDEVASNVVLSIFRNPDALINLCRIKTVDEYTYLHSVSSCALMAAFGRVVGCDEERIHELAIGALLQDMGKMRVPTWILNKPARLSPEEFNIIKGHVDLGGELLLEQRWLSGLSREVAAQHHERIDGSGYPLGLMGEEISEAGRMAAIIDVYDAITSQRCYRNPCEPTVTLGRMMEWSPGLFDEALMHQFVRCIGIYPVGTLVRLENNLVAVVLEQHPENLLKPRVRAIYDAGPKHFIMSKELDLDSSGLSIVESMAPKKLNIDPQRFL